MNKQEAYSALIKIAADLVCGKGAMSTYVEDYPQKTYSRSRLAKKMGKFSEMHRVWGVKIKDAVDALRKDTEKEGGG